MIRRVRSSILLIAMAACASAAACKFGDDSDNEVLPATQDGGPDASADVPETGEPEAAQPEAAQPEASDPDVGQPEAAVPPDLQGTWAQLWVTSSFDTLPAIGQVVGTTTSLNLVKMQQQGTALSMHVDVCTVKVDSGTQMVTEVLPEAFVKALGPLDRVAELKPGAQGWDFVQPTHIEPHSVNLTDPQNEALPTEPTDPRVVDGDGDGKPGLTILITGLIDGQIYVVVRDVHEVAGQVVSDTRIDGLIDWTKDQNVLGSDNAILASNPTKSVPNTDADKSYVRMLAVAAESDCPWLISNWQALFGR